MYSLFWFWILATAWFSIASRDKERSSLFDAGWILTSAGGMLTHYFFLFPWCATIAFLFFRRPEKRGRLVLQIIAVVLLIAPWYRHVPDSLKAWRVTQDWLSLLPFQFNRAGAVLELGLQFFSNSGHYLWWDHPTAKIVLYAAFALLGAVLLLRLRSRISEENRLLLWLWFAAAWSGPVAFDLVRHTYAVNTPRYAISALPAAAMLGGVALSCLGRASRFAILGIILGAWSLSLRDIYNNPNRVDEPFWKIGQILSAKAKAGDLILVHGVPTAAIGVARYSQSPAKIASWVGQLGERTVPESILSLTSGYKHVFLVRIHDVGEPAPEETWLRQRGRVLNETTHLSSTTIEFELPELPPE